MTVNDKLLDRLQKLSNLASKNSSPEEAELESRRDELVEAAAQKAAADRARAERAGISTATTMTIADLVQAEHAANVDFRFGDGTSARWAAERAEKAERQREADEAYTAWAREHPEEAAAEATKARRTRNRYRGGSSRDDVDRSAYWAGYDLAGDIGIEQQADTFKSAGALR